MRIAGLSQNRTSPVDSAVGNTGVKAKWLDPTFQIIDGLFQLGHRPLSKLSTSLSLREVKNKAFNQDTRQPRLNVNLGLQKQSNQNYYHFLKEK